MNSLSITHYVCQNRVIYSDHRTAFFDNFSSIEASAATVSTAPSSATIYSSQEYIQLSSLSSPLFPKVVTSTAVSQSSTSMSLSPLNTRTPLDAVGGPGGLAVVVITVVFVVGLMTAITTVILIVKTLQKSEFDRNDYCYCYCYYCIFSYFVDSY